MSEPQYTPARPCSAPGCEKPRGRKSSYCNTHRHRLYLHGGFDPPVRQPRASWRKGKYERHPVVDDATGCHNWSGATNNMGYGVITRDGQKWLTHRFYWTQRHGEIPEGLQLDHLCRNRRCCNPDHCELVTNRENTLRGNSPNMVAHRENRCRRGHELTPENSDRKANGTRQCRICRRAATNARRKAARA